MSRVLRDLVVFFVPVTGVSLAGFCWHRWVNLRGEVARYKALIEDLEHRATHDPLTGLPNRVLLMDRIEHALALTARSEALIALFYLDIDRFKEVNDAFGHETGDRLLKLVAHLLRKCVRNEDTVARLSGDEFAVFLEKLKDTREVAGILERLSNTLNSSVVLDGHKISISVSIGAALLTSSNNPPAKLLGKADTAMYQVKRGGKGNYKIYVESDQTFGISQVDV